MELSNTQHESFAQYVVAGMSLTEAAKRAGYKHSAANNMGSRLNKDPRIQMRITELRDFHTQHALTAAGIRNPQSRVSSLEDRWLKMRQVITERSEDPEMQSIPGGRTGLMVMTFKQMGSGKEAAVVREYRVDTALLTEMRATEQQAAEELGQWTTRRETLSQSLSLSITDSAQLNEAIKMQLAGLPNDARGNLLELAPPELAQAIQAECEVAKEPEKE